MSNPLATAFKGKGLYPLLARVRSITRRYGPSGAKMARSLALLRETLAEFDCQATWPTTGVALARHRALAQQQHAAGIEIAVHGLVHADHTQLTLDEQLAHLRRARHLFEQAGIPVTGFRCPYLRWNDDTLTALRETGFGYDSSQSLFWELSAGLESDAYRRVLDFYRAQPAAERLSLPRLVDGLVRIPYALPDDEALVERLRLNDGQAMAEIWLDILRRTYDAGELFTIGLHPERAALCLTALRAVLRESRSLSPPVWIARLDEIAAWQRGLAQATFELKRADDGAFHLKVNGPPAASLCFPAGERRPIAKNPFILRAERRPVIGLALDSPPALGDFLRQQGYLFEIDADARDYSLYLHRAAFDARDERPLLAEIARSGRPLAHLGRWPGDAPSALSVTGDIDTFSLWDYGLRMWGR